MKRRRQGERTVERRLAAIQLVEQGMPQTKVAETLGVGREMVRRWLRAYETGGREALEGGMPGPRSPFTEYEFRALVNEAAAAGEDTIAGMLRMAPSILGGEISRSALRRWLIRLGLWTAAR